MLLWQHNDLTLTQNCERFAEMKYDQRLVAQNHHTKDGDSSTYVAKT